MTETTTAGVPGPPRFDPQSLAEADRMYDRAEMSTLERGIFDRIASKIRSYGYVEKDDLADVVRWRSQRQSGPATRNDPDETIEISRLALTGGVSDRVRLMVLTLLDGISERHAATLLAMWDPETYVPWTDAIGVLLQRGDRLPTGEPPQLPAIWPRYLAAVRALAEESGMTLRRVEKALYVLSGGHRDTAATAVAAARPAASSHVESAGIETGDIHDEAGTALLRELTLQSKGVKDMDAVRERADKTLALTTEEQRKLLLRLHRSLCQNYLFTKTSRDLGFLYYANDVGKGLVGEVALRMPRGTRDVMIVAYLPVQTSSGKNHTWFRNASATQQKGHIPTDQLDEDDLLRAFEDARRFVLLR